MKNTTRKEWLNSLLCIVTPVLQALEKEERRKSALCAFGGFRKEHARPGALAGGGGT